MERAWALAACWAGPRARGSTAFSRSACGATRGCACGWGAERCPRRRQVDGARPMDEVFANIDGVLSAFIEDHAPAEAAVA